MTWPDDDALFETLFGSRFRVDAAAGGDPMRPLAPDPPRYCPRCGCDKDAGGDCAPALMVDEEVGVASCPPRRSPDLAHRGGYRDAPIAVAPPAPARWSRLVAWVRALTRRPAPP